MQDLMHTVGVEAVNKAPAPVCQYIFGDHESCCGKPVAQPHAARGTSSSYCLDHWRLVSTPVPKRAHRKADKSAPQQRKHTARVTNPATFDFRAYGVPNPTHNW